MPRARHVSTYPAEYTQFLREVAAGNTIIDIPFPSALIAVRWRGQFYAFLGAVRREGEAGREPWPALAAASWRIMARVIHGPDGSASIRIEHRDRSWQAEAARTAVRTPVTPVVTPSLTLQELATIDGTQSPPTERHEQRDAESAPKVSGRKYY